MPATADLPSLVARAGNLELATVEEHDARTKRDVWRQIGKRLIAQGLAAHEVGQEIRRRIDEFLLEGGYQGTCATAHFYGCMHEFGWSNPKYDRTTKPAMPRPMERQYDSDTEDPELAPAAGASHTSQSSTYHNSQHETTSEKTPSSEPPEPEEPDPLTENEEWITVLREMASALTRCAAPNLLKAVSMQEALGPAYKTTLQELRWCRDRALAAASQKEKVVPESSHLFKAALAEGGGLLKVAENYHTAQIYLIRQGRKWIDSKQAHKFGKGREPNMLELFRPKSRDEAIYHNWYGLQCPECKSWRVQRQTTAAGTGCECTDCRHMFPGHTATTCQSCFLPLYQEVIEAACKNKNRCPQCGHVLWLPDELRPAKYRGRAENLAPAAIRTQAKGPRSEVG